MCPRVTLWLTPLLAVLLALPPRTARAETPPPLTPEQKAKLKERDRLRVEVMKLYGAGKVDEALAAAERVVKLEKEALGEGHPEVIVSLQWLAEFQEAVERFTAAVRTRKEILALQEKGLGRGLWEVTEARLAAAD